MKLLRSSQHTYGFTLAELLISVSIIMTIVTASLIGGVNIMRRARDTKRVDDINRLSDALHLYFTDHGQWAPESDADECDTSVGVYPGPNCTSIPNPPSVKNWDTNSHLQHLILDNYIDSLPVDPLNNAQYYYRFELDDELRGFRLTAQLEAGSPGETHIQEVNDPVEGDVD
jgi:type II secretory pathway pseudopilin PulG